MDQAMGRESAEDSKRALREWLARDHDEIDALLRKALRFQELDGTAFAAFRERLLRHIGIEERILFPAARRTSPDGALSRLTGLRNDHAALTSLLVPTPDRELALELAALLEPHNALEDRPGGVYDECIGLLTHDVAQTTLERARTRAPVPTKGYFDGPGTVRTAAEALAKARR